MNQYEERCTQECIFQGACMIAATLVEGAYPRIGEIADHQLLIANRSVTLARDIWKEVNKQQASLEQQ